MSGVRVFVCMLAIVCLSYGYYIEEIEQTEFEYDLQEPVQDYLYDDETALEAKKCDCNEKTGCFCFGEKGGITVKVYLSLDELERHGKEHIMVHVCVNGNRFVKILPVNRLKKFCHTVKGRRYCFATKVSDDGREDTLPGCIKMTKPIKLNLGCFVLPL